MSSTDIRVTAHIAHITGIPPGPHRQWRPAAHYRRNTDALGRSTEFANRGNLVNTNSKTTPDRPRTSRLVDDFNRTVATFSPDSGTTHRSFDAADRMIASTDAQGHQAKYEYDPQGRIQRQTITDAKTQQSTETVWRYENSKLIAVIHPTQTERFEYDTRGLRVAKITTLNTGNKITAKDVEHTSITRYQFDDAGVLQSTSLPDGTQISYVRNGQGQVTEVKRERIQTPWLRWAAPAQTIAKDLQRDIVGLKSYTAGNGIQAQFQRSAQGALAQVVYRNANQSNPPVKVANKTLPQLLGQTTADTIHILLGIAPAHAAEPTNNTTAKAARTAPSKPATTTRTGRPEILTVTTPTASPTTSANGNTHGMRWAG